MAEAIVVPQVGQDLTEAKVVALHVKLGDEVKRGDIVAEVESEKATFEVEAFSAGTVIELPFKVGDTATVLEPLMLVGAPGEMQPHAKASGPTPTAASATPVPASAAGGQIDIRPTSVGGSHRSSPLARRVAQGNGFAVADIPGTGPGNAVVLRDVEAWIELKRQQQAPAAPLHAAASGGTVRGLKPGDGLPVLFVHGFGGDLSTWRTLVDRLTIGNPAIGIDLPGHGGAEGGASSFAQLVDAVGNRIVSAGRTRLHLVGHSLGAAVALALTARDDLEVRSITLISPAGLATSIDGAFISGFLEARSEAALSSQMSKLVHDPARLPAALVRATLSARRDGDLVARQRALADAVFEGSTQLFSVRPEINAYTGPCRVILGRSDRIIPSAETEASLPGAVSVHRLEATGHLPFVETPALVARLIDETVRSAG